jgi:hypothetical protein
VSETPTPTKPQGNPKQKIEIRNNTRQIVRLCFYDTHEDGSFEGRHDEDIVIGDKADADIPDKERTPETPSPIWKGTRGQIDKLPEKQRAFLDGLIKTDALELREV